MHHTFRDLSINACSSAVDRSRGADARAHSIPKALYGQREAIQGRCISCGTRGASAVGSRAAGDTHPNARPERSTAQVVYVHVWIAFSAGGDPSIAP